MKARPNRIITLIAASTVCLGAWPGWAAKAPLSDEARKKQSTHIVTGEVVDVTSKVQKSKVEKAIGTHRDKVFRIRVKVETITKGEGIAKGDEILIIAWQPHTRIPQLPGLQGHGSIPKKGDVATFYLEKDGTSFEPLLPNGIDIEKPEK